jgi:hypothetical protein
VDRLEKAVRTRFPRIKHIYIEAEAITSARALPNDGIAAATENKAIVTKYFLTLKN